MCRLPTLLQLKRLAFWLGVIALIVIIGRAATWLLDALDLNDFVVRFLVFLARTLAFLAVIVQSPTRDGIGCALFHSA